jgi:hypothetical protein
MSEDPKTGVVDANCNVHGFNNLYIAGASCFATRQLGKHCINSSSNKPGTYKLCKRTNENLKR